MENNFTVEEKKKYMFKKHIKNHLFEYILDFMGPILLAILILYLGKSQEYMYGIACSIVYSIGRLIYNLKNYKKEYIDIDIK